MSVERRISAPGRIEVRETSTGLRVEGTAIVFGAWSDIGPFMERVQVGAADDALRKAGDLLLVWNHETSSPLARRGRGLTVWADARGVHFRGELANTTAGRDAVELIRAGVCEGCSFAFTVAKDGELVEYRDGREWRTITRMGRLFELTLTPVPAYQQTSVAVARARLDEKRDPVEAARERVRRALDRHNLGETMSTTLAKAEAARTRHRPLTVRERSPYGERSEHSWFLDQAAAAQDLAARERLARHQAAPERRAVNTQIVGGLVSFSGVTWADEEIAAAARSAAPLLAALEHHPLPETGTAVPWATIRPATSAAQVQASDNVGLVAPTSDPAIAVTLGPLATIAEYIDFTFQSRDRSGGELDRQIATEMASLYAAKLEGELWVGTGASGRVLGLVNVAGVNASTVSGQTLALTANQVTNMWQQVATSLGRLPELVAMAPRRAAILDAATDALGLPLSGLVPPGCELVVSPAAPANLGGGTNEDWIIVAHRVAAPIAAGPVEVEWHAEGPAAGTNLTGRFLMHGYISFGSSRRPEGIGLVKGLTPPTFT